MQVLDSRQVVDFVSASLGRIGRDPALLLQQLIAVQQRFSHVPVAAVDALADALDVTRTQVRAAVTFYAFCMKSRGAISTSCSATISPTGCWAISGC